jgi:hypothetical protein
MPVPGTLRRFQHQAIALKVDLDIIGLHSIQVDTHIITLGGHAFLQTNGSPVTINAH